MISGRKCLLMNKHLSHGDRHKTVSCEGWRWMGQVALRDDYWVPRGPFCPQEVCRANMMNLEVGQVCREFSWRPGSRMERGSSQMYCVRERFHSTVGTSMVEDEPSQFEGCGRCMETIICLTFQMCQAHVQPYPDRAWRSAFAVRRAR